MRRSIAVAMFVMVMLAFSGVAQAQVGVGLKVPPLVLPNFFVSYWAGDNLLLEGAATLSVFGEASSISAGANAKLFFDAVQIAELAFWPYVGAGPAWLLSR